MKKKQILAGQEDMRMKSRRGRWKWISLFVTAILFTVLLPQIVFKVQNRRIEGSTIKVEGSEKEQEVLSVQSFYETEQLIQELGRSGKNLELESMWTWSGEEFLKENSEIVWDIRIKIEEEEKKQLLRAVDMIHFVNLSSVNCYQLKFPGKEGDILKTTVWKLNFQRKKEFEEFEEYIGGFTDQVPFYRNYSIEDLSIFVNPKDYKTLLLQYSYSREKEGWNSQYELDEIADFCKNFSGDKNDTLYMVDQDNKIVVCYGNIQLCGWMEKSEGNLEE